MGSLSENMLSEKQRISNLLREYVDSETNPKSPGNVVKSRTSEEESLATRRSQTGIASASKHLPLSSSSTQAREHSYGNAFELDSTNFDVNKYFQNMIESVNLQDLLRFSNSLVSQIKALDGDMRTLVYENYSKFIAASDTIHQIKSNFEGMETDVTKLSTSMRTIQVCANQLHEAVATRSTMIEELTSVRRLLTQLQTVLMLPSFLESSIAENRCEEAIRLHLHCKDFLMMHNDILSCKETLEKSTVLYEEAKTTLKNRLQFENNIEILDESSVKTFAESISAIIIRSVSISEVLLESGESPSELFELYLRSAHFAMRKFLDILFDYSSLFENAKKNLETDATSRTTLSQLDLDAKQYFGNKKSYTSDLSTPSEGKNGMENQEEQFVTIENEVESNVNEAIFGVLCNFITDDFSTVLIEYIVNARGIFASAKVAGKISNYEEVCNEFTSTIIELLFAKVADFVQNRINISKSLQNGIMLLETAMHRIDKVVSGAITDLFSRILSDLTRLIARLRFRKCFDDMMDHIRAIYRICAADETVSEGILRSVSKIEKEFLLTMCVAITDCLPLYSCLSNAPMEARSNFISSIFQLTISTIQFFNALCQKICVFPLPQRQTYIDENEVAQQFQLQSLYQNILDESASLSIFKRQVTTDYSIVQQVVVDAWYTPYEKELQALEWNDMFALLLVRICRHFEVKSIQKIMFVFKEICTSFINDDDDTAAILSGLDSTKASATSLLIQTSRDIAQALLTSFVFHYGNRLSDDLAQAMLQTDWVLDKEPTMISDFVLRILENISKINEIVSSFLGDPWKLPTSNQHHRRMLRFFGGKRNYMQLEMERLFARKMVVYKSIEFNRSAAVTGVTQIMLKSFIEIVRQPTFNTFGVQQIQLDCAFLSEVLRDFVTSEEASNMDAAFDEVLFSASYRCLELTEEAEQSQDVVLLDNSVVQELCDQYKAQLSFLEK